MRTWIVVAAVLLAGMIGFALPIRSQDETRIGVAVDVTALAEKIDRVGTEIEQLREETKKLNEALDESNETLAVIAAGVGIIREPVRWEYQFVRTRSEDVANEHGDDGWELVTIFREDWFVFRRPLHPRRPEAREE